MGSPFITSVAWSPDGKLIAIGAIVPPAQVVAADDGRLVRTFPVNGASGVAWSPNGTYLVTAYEAPSDTLHVWELAPKQNRLAFTIDPPGKASSAAWSHDGRKLAVGVGGLSNAQGGVSNSAVNVYGTGQWPLMATLVYTDYVSSVSWSPDDRYIAFGSSSAAGDVNALVVWDTASRQRALSFIPTYQSGANNVAWSPANNKLVAVGFVDGKAGIWDVTSGQRTATLVHGDYLVRVAWSPDGKRLASGGDDGTVKVWDPLSGQKLKEFTHPSSVTSIDWSPDGKVLAAGCNDNAVWLWDVK